MRFDVNVAYPAGNVVGESIIWDNRLERLIWVDIVSKSINSFRPTTGEHHVWSTPEMPTSIGLRKDGGAIVGFLKTLAVWNYDDNFHEVAKVEPDVSGNRLNEGVVGPDGAFWFGTMQNNIGGDGSPKAMTGEHGRLYRYTPDGQLFSLSADHFGITNTFVWLGDGTVLTADTLRNEVYSYKYDPASSSLQRRHQVFSEFPRGLPDGSCIDEDGFIWNCRVGGGCVVRFDASGRVDRVIDLPCSQPTSCTFGGNDLSTLYVTSARFSLSEERIRSNSLEGGLFALDVGVKGHEAHRFG